ncbi:MAG: hypothetical protein ACRD1K_11710 [Acidimicrobiales bacterium]
MPGTDDGRAEVLGWLKSAFDEVRGDLRALEETGRRQQRAIARLSRGGEMARLVELAENLPPRVNEVLASAAAATEQERAERQAAHQELAARVERSQQEAEASATKLLQEIDRLALAQKALAERQPVPFDQDSLPQVAGAAWQAMKSRLSTRRQPPPSPPGVPTAKASVVGASPDRGIVGTSDHPATEGTTCE